MTWRFAMIVVVLGVGCTRNHALSGDAGADRLVDDDRGDVVTSDVGYADGPAGDRVAPPPDAQPSRPPGLLFPDAPSVACRNPDDCGYPPPQCALLACEDGGQSCGIPALWMVYYDEPRCGGGHCQWDTKYYQCGDQLRCGNGSCIPNVTIP
jgi:hypothetical protein